MEELLTGTARLELTTTEEAVRAIYPGSGFTQLPLVLHRPSPAVSSYH
jgi:hypothetical protein